MPLEEKNSEFFEIKLNAPVKVSQIPSIWATVKVIRNYWIPDQPDLTTAISGTVFLSNK